MISFIQPTSGQITRNSDRLRCAVVERDPAVRDVLIGTIEGRADAEVVAVCDRGSAAASLLERTSPDLVFLEVRRSNDESFNLMEEIGTRASAVAFVSDTEEHAVRAFELSAVDYLLIPLDPSRVNRVIDKTLALSGVGGSIDDAAGNGNDQSSSSGSPFLRYLPVRDGERVFLQRVESISLFESEGKSVRVHADSRKHSVRMTMQRLEDSLDPHRFLRINRFSIVNIDHVHHLEPWSHGEWVIILQTGHRVVSTRSYHAGLRRLLAAF
jgi:two-component system, LytTR family, response regulator